MGFGLMFVGYFFVYVMSYVFIPKLLGYLIMLVASVKLSAYELKFKPCVPILGFMSVISAYALTENILDHFGVVPPMFGEGILNVVSTAEEILTIAFHAFLMLAINSIARSTGLDKLCFRAMRNLLLIGIAEMTYLIVLLLPKNNFVQYVFFAAVILRFIWIVLDLLLLVSCYRMICEEGDESMPDKEIKIPIIKQMEAIMRRRDKNAFDSALKWSEKIKNKKENKSKNKK